MKQQQVIDILIQALEFYADPQYWVRVYGQYKNDRRMWVGPGDGGDLAQRALEEVRKGVKKDTPNTLHGPGNAVEKGA